MNKLVRRIKRTTVREKHKMKHSIGKKLDIEQSKMDVCFADDSSDSGFDTESRMQLLSRRDLTNSTLFDRGSNDLDRDSSDDSIDSGIFGVSSADELNSSDASSNSDARVTVVEDTEIANLLCQSISINEDDANVLQYCDDNASEPPNKRRCIVVTDKASDMQVEISGDTNGLINLYGIASQAERPQITAYRTNNSSKNSLTTNHSLNSRRKLNRKPPSLHATYPSRVKEGQIDLRILSQPEEQHRARYMTEGSRGAIKDRRGSGFPTVKLFGYNQPVTLQVFIGSDQGKIQPHLFYQACKVSGKNCTPCTERVIDGTTVIEISMLPDKDMTVSCDCIGILKERNVDVEQRLPYFNMTRAKKKNTRCRMIFRVNLPLPESGTDTLQAASSPILCTQPPGVPEISKKSIKECSVTGGTELFIIGKNFLKDTKILFEEESRDCENEMNKIWQEVVEPEKEFLHQTHLVCRVPPYRRQSISEPVKVQLSVQSGGKTSEPHTFIYLPVKQGLDNVTRNFPTITSGIPEIGQQLSRSQLMPAFIQVPAPLTTSSVPTVVVSQSSNFIAFPRGSVPDPTLKPIMTQKLLQNSPKVRRTLTKTADENGCNSNQIHVVVLQQQSEKNVKRAHHISSGNRFKSNCFPGKRLHRFNHKGKLLSTSRGKHCTNHPYQSVAQPSINQILTSTTSCNPVFKQADMGALDQMTVDNVSRGQNGAITSAIISQDVNTTTAIQEFTTDITTNVQSTDLFSTCSVISSANEIEHVHSQIQENQNIGANCLQQSLSPNGISVQEMSNSSLASLKNDVSLSNQTGIQPNMINTVGMQPMMNSGSNLLESEATLIPTNELIQTNENILSQQNELIQSQMDQSIIITGETNNSISSVGELTPNECQSIQLKQQLSNNDLCLAISQSDLLNIQNSGLCTAIIDVKLPNETTVGTTKSTQSASNLSPLVLKQELDSKEFLQQAQPVIINSVITLPRIDELRNNEISEQNLDAALKNDLLIPVSSSVITQDLSPSPNFITIHSSEQTSQNCMNEAMLQAPRLQLPSENILRFSTDPSAVNAVSRLDISSINPLTRPLKVEPMLSQAAQLDSPNPITISPNGNNLVTTCLQPPANGQPIIKFTNSGIDVKQEKPNTENNCDMSNFQNSFANELSMLSDTDLLSLINPSTFDIV